MLPLGVIFERYWDAFAKTDMRAARYPPSAMQEPKSHAPEGLLELLWYYATECGNSEKKFVSAKIQVLYLDLATTPKTKAAMSVPSAPPPRPFLGVRSPNFSVSSQDWVVATDDDPWDSASDNERSPSKGIPINRHTSGLRSPKRKDSSSSSNLALSYTHITAPSPGSYPGKAPDMSRTGGNNLTSGASETAIGSTLGAGSKGEGSNGKDGTSWMIVPSPRPDESGRDDEAMEDAFDTTIEELVEPPLSAKRLQEGKEAIKYDVDDFVNGTDEFRSFAVSICLS